MQKTISDTDLDKKTTADIYDYEAIDANELLDLLELTEAFANALAQRIEDHSATQNAFDAALNPPNNEELTPLAEAYLVSHFEDLFGFGKALDEADEEPDPTISRKKRIQAMIDHVQQRDLYIKFLQGEDISGNAPIISLPFMCSALPQELKNADNVSLLRTIHAYSLADIADQKPPMLN